MNDQHERRVLVIGEALTDVVTTAGGERREHPGGSPANVAVTLGRLGRRPRFATSIGHDDRGRRIRSWLDESGVELTPAAVGTGPTSVAASRLDDDGGASYEFALRWEPDLPRAGDASLVHVGSVATLLEPGAGDVLRLVEEARATATITYDPNLRPSIRPDRAAVRRRVERLVQLADVVKVSDEDLRWLYPGEPFAGVLRRWAAGGAVVVGTRGAEGALLVTARGELDVPGRRVDVVDTIGAGDAFMGGLIHGMVARGLVGADRRGALHGTAPGDWSGVVALAAEVAARTVARSGANPPWLAELDEAAVAP
ncbi:carbohydrate kinase family protein [Myceligenerans pegani]|uniref:Carbohydrate kinase n=1 Tax=Myceligenerans pegani TaxID=2776917 RepID=A0ABR9MZA8_9MICO|nr:carbohydrate kinase [Myceligenerans sp. TRM 65318]MBE1876321.1 carbohydrate kinase [Myceligenerans sp. TRM 65318]MBE3018592.1 carbohydrate kinase [Myceligenerans sp. TRM 65318]